MKISRKIKRMSIGLVFFLVMGTVTGIMTISAGAVNGNDIVAVAEQWLGTPYGAGSDGSGGPGTSVDCSTLIMQVYASCGISVPRYASGQATVGERVDIKDLQPGDIVCFSWKQGGAIEHTGIYVGGDAMIHCPGKGKEVKYGNYISVWNYSKSGCKLEYGRRVVDGTPSVESQSPASAPVPAGISDPSVTLSRKALGGQHNETTRELQESLNYIMNAGLEADGVFGTATAEAVEAFQEMYGLNKDGEAGPITLNKVNEVLAAMEREHTHNYSVILYEGDHPHREYEQCACGEVQYTGWLITVETCPVCVKEFEPAATEEWGDHIYRLYEGALTWKEAEAVCEDLGGHLATVNSAEEQEMLFGLIQDGIRHAYYIGGTDEAAESVWNWVTGEPWTTGDYWADGEPSNGEDPEHYLEINKEGGTWNSVANDDRANGARGFICEIESISVFTEAPDEIPTAEPTEAPRPIWEPVFPTVHFAKQAEYSEGQFADVAIDRWYAPGVASAFEFGLMKGESETAFSPDGEVTIAEAVTMASRIHSLYTTGKEDFVQGEVWYETYLDYAREKGIIGEAYEKADVTRNATRAQFAEILAHALPDEGLYPINNVTDGAIPDIADSATYRSDVYKLYRAGILVGNDANGTFAPDSSITRAEVATIVSRMAESDNRKAFSLK